jgi:hypothetical protein
VPATERTGSAASPPATAPALPGAAGRPHRAANGYATAALALGAAGFTLVTALPAVVFAILGLRRARSSGAGALRCRLGIGLAVAWAVAGGLLIPRLVQASDPGCTAYKGPALTAYKQAIDDFGGRSPRIVTGDLSRAIMALGTAAARSHSRLASRDLSHFAAQLRIVRADVSGGRAVPGSALSALNRAAADTDSDCGTVRF